MMILGIGTADYSDQYQLQPIILIIIPITRLHSRYIGTALLAIHSPTHLSIYLSTIYNESNAI